MDEQQFVNFRREIFEHFLALKKFRQADAEIRRLDELETSSNLRNPIDRFLFRLSLYFWKKTIGFSKARRVEAHRLLANEHLKAQICSLASSIEAQTNKEELIVDVIASAFSDPACRIEYSIQLDYELFGECCYELSLLDLGKFCSSCEQ